MNWNMNATKSTNAVKDMNITKGDYCTQPTIESRCPAINPLALQSTHLPCNQRTCPAINPLALQLIYLWFRSVKHGQELQRPGSCWERLGWHVQVGEAHGCLHYQCALVVVVVLGVRRTMSMMRSLDVMHIVPPLATALSVVSRLCPSWSCVGLQLLCISCSLNAFTIFTIDNWEFCDLLLGQSCYPRACAHRRLCRQSSGTSGLEMYVTPIANGCNNYN